ncbi:MAG: hypothetical protein QXV84_02535 [Conexivisphaerales archaeon]
MVDDELFVIERLVTLLYPERVRYVSNRMMKDGSVKPLAKRGGFVYEVMSKSSEFINGIKSLHKAQGQGRLIFPLKGCISKLQR